MTYITPIESSRRALAFGSVKTRFKAFWSMFFFLICVWPWIRSLRFYWTFAPGGRLNYEAYNVDTKSQSLKTIQKTLTITKTN